jgi:site-specific DNA-cytosine methylase
VFEQLNPSVRLEGDFRQLDVAAVPGCDVYDAGVPCQSFSVASELRGTKLKLQVRAAARAWRREKIVTARLPINVVLACQNHCMERAHESKTVEGKLY